jgi:hypothetical protein
MAAAIEQADALRTLERSDDLADRGPGAAERARGMFVTTARIGLTDERIASAPTSEAFLELVYDEALQ